MKFLRRLRRPKDPWADLMQELILDKEWRFVGPHSAEEDRLHEERMRVLYGKRADERAKSR